MLKAWETERVRIVENLLCSPMVLIPIGTRFSSILAVYRSASLAFYLEYHHSVAHVSALRGSSCQIDAKGKENVGQHHTYDKLLRNGTLSQKRSWGRPGATVRIETLINKLQGNAKKLEARNKKTDQNIYFKISHLRSERRKRHV